MKNKKEILEKLKDDEHYYGEYGRQFISNSDIRTLMTNPLEFKKPTPTAPHFLIGGYFHTAILEPDKIKNFKIVEASSRNTKAYKFSAYFVVKYFIYHSFSLINFML